MIQKAITFIEEHNMISKYDLVAVGVSGGADSLCLLFVLLEYQKKVPFELVAVHVNHKIREDAEKDADFVRDICGRQKVPFYLKETDVKKLADEQHLSEEEAGRKVRYEAFAEALDQYQNQLEGNGKEVLTSFLKQEDRTEGKRRKIAVAHHQGDSAETLLFHLFRGTGIYGLAGILPVNGDIIRPLLTCSRKEIEEYLTERGEKWCIDSTNEEDTYTRNKIRHHILGYADREINEKSTEHIAKAALQMADFREYLETEIKQMMMQIAKKGKEEICIDISELKKYPKLLQSQFLLAAIGETIPGRKDVCAEHIQGILDLLYKTGTKKMNLPKNLEVVKEYQILWIRKKKMQTPVEKDARKLKRKEDLGMISDIESKELKIEKSYFLKDGSILEISLIKAEDFSGIEEKKYTKYFDYDKINNYLKLRFRQAGDYLTINDKGQKKTLKEYFINEKVPASIRSKIPVIADGNHILWIIGYRISAYYKVTSETQKVLQINIRRDKNVRES